jgi:saccharopine dehydrogenase (NADP+, L-glutamate forming)
VCLFSFILNQSSAKDAGITVMNEIGLDPGIDHLYAVKTIEEVHKEGGKVSIFFFIFLF